MQTMLSMRRSRCLNPSESQLPNHILARCEAFCLPEVVLCL